MLTVRVPLLTGAVPSALVIWPALMVTEAMLFCPTFAPMATGVEMVAVPTPDFTREMVPEPLSPITPLKVDEALRPVLIVRMAFRTGVNDEAGAAEAVDGDALAVEVESAGIVGHEVEHTAVGHRTLGGKLERTFLDDQVVQRRAGRQNVVRAGEQQRARTEFDEIGAGEVREDRSGLIFLGVNEGVIRRRTIAENEVEGRGPSDDIGGGAIEEQS